MKSSLVMVYTERWGSSPFDVRYKGNEPQADHIYPQSMLRTRLSLLSADIDDIGNLRFVGPTDNNRKRAELPASYFARLKAEQVDIEKHLLLPDESANPQLLAFDLPTYTRFRERRRAAIWSLLKRVVDPESPAPA